MAKIEVAVIEDEGGATHVKQTWTFKYGNRKRDLLSHLEKHHGFGALSDGDAIVSSDDFLEVGKYNYHGYQQVPPAGIFCVPSHLLCMSFSTSFFHLLSSLYSLLRSTVSVGFDGQCA
jgi:hypothetical protein